MNVVEVEWSECDACPYEAHVAAYVYADHDDWPVGISYCAHHGRKYIPGLIACGATVIDLRYLLEADRG